jgi:CheY-like chemotaxis protein
MGGSVFVLFVDDDAAFADEAARSLETIGIRTVVALGSLAALDAFDANAIDAVVTDIKLPAGDDNGLALARMIRNKRPRVPIILMTMCPDLLERHRLALCCAILWSLPSYAAQSGCAKRSNHQPPWIVRSVVNGDLYSEAIPGRRASCRSG